MTDQLTQVPISDVGPGEASYNLWQEGTKYEPLGAQGEGKYYRPYPFFIERAQGAYLTDVDGRVLLDYWAAAGPAVLGHSDPYVLDSVVDCMRDRGVLFCAPHRSEVDLARRLAQCVPSAEKAAFVCGGSDAFAFAVRLARAKTDRQKLLKFEGAYHGWYDSVLFSVRPDIDKAGSDTRPNSVAQSSGLPRNTERDIVVLPYNDTATMAAYLRQHGTEIAMVLVEPILHSCGCIMPLPGFLERLRELCNEFGIILLFDEIITGFRHSLGGAQQILGVTPDLTALGKAMSNGFPISALVGRAHLIDELAPSGDVFFSGTFNGNILCTAAALATIERLESGKVYEHTFALGEHVRQELNAAIETFGIRAQCTGFGSVWSIYFTDQPITSYRDIIRLGPEQVQKQDALRGWLLREDIFVYPRWINRNYISASHTTEDIERTTRAVVRFFDEHRSVL